MAVQYGGVFITEIWEKLSAIWVTVKQAFQQQKLTNVTPLLLYQDRIVLVQSNVSVSL